MHIPIFEGVGTAIVTPFDDKNKVNFDRFGELIEFQIANDVDALIVCGTTGEPSTLDEKEFYEVCEQSIEKVAGRIPVILITGSNNTAVAIKRTKKAE